MTGLSAGGLIRGEEDICRSKEKVSETTDTIRQNENLYLKNEENVSFIHLFTHEKNLYLKSYLSGSKIEINAFIREGLCARGGLI